MLIALGLAVGLVPLASQAMGPYDGVYVGTQRATKTNNSTQCSRIDQDNVKVMVANNFLRYRWGQIPLEVNVASDGSFATEVAGASAGRGGSASTSIAFKGRISIGNLEADVGGNVCAGHLSLRKQ
jgi:hypothetical protein